MSRNRAFFYRDHLSGKIRVPQNVPFCLKNWTNSGANLVFTMCWLFLVFAVWRLWASVRVVPYLWGKGSLRCCNNTSCWGMDDERAKKDTRKVDKLEKHAGIVKFRKTSRLFEAHLGIFSGLVDQELVARCFRVLQYQLSSTITCQKEKERQSQNLGKSVTLSRDNQCKLPYLIGWLHARSARRNFCLSISGNSWMVKVSQYDINVWVFLVCVASRVYAGVPGRCGVVDFFASFLFSLVLFCSLSFYFLFFFLLFFLFFHFHFYQFVQFFIFSFFSISSFFSSSHFVHSFHSFHSLHFFQFFCLFSLFA